TIRPTIPSFELPEAPAARGTASIDCGHQAADPARTLDAGLEILDQRYPHEAGARIGPAAARRFATPSEIAAGEHQGVELVVEPPGEALVVATGHRQPQVEAGLGPLYLGNRRDQGHHRVELLAVEAA